MRYKIIQHNVKLVFLTNILEWKKGDIVYSDVYIGEDANKYYFISGYIFNDHFVIPIQELRNNIIDLVISN